MSIVAITSWAFDFFSSPEAKLLFCNPEAKRGITTRFDTLQITGNFRAHCLASTSVMLRSFCRLGTLLNSIGIPRFASGLKKRPMTRTKIFTLYVIFDLLIVTGVVVCAVQRWPVRQYLIPAAILFVAAGVWLVVMTVRSVPPRD
jgi:hypothetical protein